MLALLKALIGCLAISHPFASVYNTHPSGYTFIPDTMKEFGFLHHPIMSNIIFSRIKYYIIEGATNLYQILNCNTNRQSVK